MRHSRILAAATCLLLLVSLAGTAMAAASYNHTQPGRAPDPEIESAVKASLTEKDPNKALLINVYSFLGHVFMVGEPGPAFGPRAEQAAHHVEATHFVTAHWFPENTADPKIDPALKSAVEASLRPLMHSPNRVVVEVWGSNVVVLGIVQTPEEVAQGAKLAQTVHGVKTFRSYLMTSEQALKAIGNPSDLYQK